MSRNVRIKNLAEVLAARAARPDVFKPQKVDGKWRKPKFTGKAIATLRRRYYEEGKEWKWDVPHKIVEKRVEFKGKKRDLRAKEKAAEIEKRMKLMPKLVAEYHERERERRKKKRMEGLSFIDKLLEEPRDLSSPSSSSSSKRGIKTRFNKAS